MIHTANRTLFFYLSLAVYVPIQALAQAPPPPSQKSLKAANATTPASLRESNGVPDARANRGIPEQYIIGEGDVLQVSVWKEPDASLASVVVRADGKITMPFIKEVIVSGLTAAQAEELMTAKLKPFLTDPDVTIVVREVHSKKIYLVGAVRRTGPVELRYPMTVLQAITEAGGLNDFAKRKEIYVLRTQDGTQHRLPFNYQAAIRGEAPTQNYWLIPNDMVIVPQ